MFTQRPLLTPIVFTFCISHALAQEMASELADLPFEQLMSMDLTVNSASKREEKLIDTAAAVHIITAEDISRSSANHIPELLRMVPGVQVARIGASEWGVSARGLGGRFSRYLLVLVDGRSVYDPLFSGVNWDELNINLIDIERIEVIRGPGGALWGSNAVNGVINIVTKSATRDEGQKLIASAGNIDNYHASFQQSLLINPHTHLRWSIAAKESDGFKDANNLGLNEGDWQAERFALALNHQHDKNHFTFNFDAYQSQDNNFWPDVDPIDPQAPNYLSQDKSGYALQLAWQHQLSEQQSINSRFSADSIDRDLNIFQWDSDNIDLDIELAGEWQQHLYTLGFNSRLSKSKVDNLGYSDFTLSPAEQDIDTYSVFFQNEWRVNDTFSLIAGAKHEDNSELGKNTQPTVRAKWKIHQDQRLWAAWSQAESTPSRIQINNSRLEISAIPGNPQLPFPGNLPVLLTIGHDDVLANVELEAIELGYRAQFDQINIDLTVFDHDYKKLINISPGSPVAIGSPLPSYLEVPLTFQDQDTADSKGLELDLNWQINNHWLMQYSYAYIDFNTTSSALSGLAPSNITENIAASQTVPEHSHSLRFNGKINDDLKLHLWLRYVDNMDTANIDSYLNMDISLEKNINKHLSIAISAFNLIDDDRVEYTREVFAATRYAIEKAYQLQIKYEF